MTDPNDFYIKNELVQLVHELLSFNEYVCAMRDVASDYDIESTRFWQDTNLRVRDLLDQVEIVKTLIRP